MDTADVINGVFELGGGFAILWSIVKLSRDKIVRGVSWPHVMFFSTWGFWNIFYYWHLEQPLSWYGGVFLVAMNSLWLGQILFYNLKERHKWA